MRDVIIRYAVLKPTSEPYIAPYTKKGPFKTKMMATRNLALFYSRQEQAADKVRSLANRDCKPQVDMMLKVTEDNNLTSDRADEARPTRQSTQRSRHSLVGSGNLVQVQEAKVHLEVSQRMLESNQKIFPDRDEVRNWQEPTKNELPGKDESYVELFTSEVELPDISRSVADGVVDDRLSHLTGKQGHCKVSEFITGYQVKVSNMDVPGAVPNNCSGAVEYKSGVVRLGRSSGQLKDIDSRDWVSQVKHVKLDDPWSRVLFGGSERHQEPSPVGDQGSSCNTDLSREILEKELENQDDNLLFVQPRCQEKGIQHGCLLVVTVHGDSKRRFYWTRVVDTSLVRTMKDAGQAQEQNPEANFCLGQLSSFNEASAVESLSATAHFLVRAGHVLIVNTSDLQHSIIAEMSKLMATFSNGPRVQSHHVRGVPRLISYGEPHMVSLALRYGEQVLRLPSAWLKLSPRWEAMLHLGNLNVLGADWPFMEVHTKSDVLVAPFDEQGDGEMVPIVLIVPIDFVDTKLAMLITEFSEEITARNGTIAHKIFTDCLQTRINNAEKQQFFNLINGYFGGILSHNYSWK